MSRVFTVRLARPVFQTAVVEVSAKDRASACRQALQLVPALADSDWSTPDFDDHEYAVHIEDAVDNQNIYETSAQPHREIREFRHGGISGGSIRYILLAADLKAKEGFLLTQPWFANTSEMLQGDMCSDWSEPLAFIVENDGLDSSALSAASGGLRYESARDNDNVINFPVSPLDEEVVESSS